MSSAIKTILVLLLVLPLVIYIGSEIGNDEYLLPGIAGALVFGIMIFGLLFRRQRPECIILMLLLGGNIIGNRGFAQIYVVQPLFVGELAMSIILAMMIFRYATAREFVLAPHLIARLIALYLLLAFARLFFDWRTYGVDAIRDSALAYYAVFFFAAYQLGRHAETAAFIDRTLVRIFLFLGVIGTVLTFQPDWLDLITIRGTSPLLQKPDITATFCSVAILFIAIRPELLRSRSIRAGLLIVLTVCMALASARAAIVALGGAMVLAWIAARRGFIVYPLVSVIFGVIALLLIDTQSAGRFAATRDQLMSIVDVSGTYVYQTDTGEIKQADNTFRRALWDSFFKHTVQDNDWLTGKGFGYNFIPDFEDEYRGGSWDSLRSAHNYFVTVFGRLGLLGFGLIVAITIEIARHSLRTALALRRRESYDAQALAYWCGVWVLLISGTFGVVLEGPMGAIPFWSMIGFALASNDRVNLARIADSTELAQAALPARSVRQPLARPAGIS